MRKYLIIFFMLVSAFARSQDSSILSTAAKCGYMTADEREMIYEINRLRANPRSYLVYITPMLEAAKKRLKEYGKGPKNYSLSFNSTNGIERFNIDTTWHFVNEEEVKALTSLVNDLKTLKPLSVLQPDSGIYTAAAKHAADQREHDWQLAHTGTDGSSPWDRITKFSPSMKFGNENIAGNSEHVKARDIVIQLLVDDGIPGYGHRYNLLNPEWTHIACKGERYHDQMSWWIQDFGVHRK
jgi:uncharacterized protein YkwD